MPDDCKCATLRTEDALTTSWLEVVAVVHNTCAPVNYYTCRCRACGARWAGLEVYDEDGKAASEWSWERDTAAT